MQRENWKPYRLNQLGYVGRGRSRSRPRNNPALYGGAYPLFETGDIKSADLYLSNPKKTYNEKGLAQSKLWNPGTVCITIAANIAETAILKIKACFPDSVAGFVADSEKADARYIKYYIDFIKLQMQNISHGTTQDNLSVEKLLTFDFFTPPLSTQRKIAAILGNYDDLIENNTRRIKILEEMAGTIYREWFVEFRFPGHENVKMVKSELGLIPQGWEVKQLGEIAQLLRGRSYRTENLVEKGQGLPFLNLKNIDREGGFRLDGIKQYDGKFRETQVASSNDIIMALTDMTQERRIVARSARVPNLGHEKYVFSMDLLKIQPNQGIQPDFLYALLRYSSIADKLKENANGTTVLHLSPSHVQSSRLVLPTIKIRQRYAEISKRIHQQHDLLERKNTNLRKTRDVLLLKLISGDLDVSELNINTDRIPSVAN